MEHKKHYKIKKQLCMEPSGFLVYVNKEVWLMKDFSRSVIAKEWLPLNF